MQTNFGCKWFFFFLLFACASSAYGQSIESDLAPPRGQFTAPSSDEAAPVYVIPDVPPQISQQLKVDRHWITMTPGLVLIGDYNAFGQDANSLSQVGKQADQFDDRAIRFACVVGLSPTSRAITSTPERSQQITPGISGSNSCGIKVQFPCWLSTSLVGSAPT
jgi:hypothetical protein